MAADQPGMSVVADALRLPGFYWVRLIYSAAGEDGWVIAEWELGGVHDPGPAWRLTALPDRLQTLDFEQIDERRLIREDIECPTGFWS